jgi:hypothetical protein
MLFFSSAGLAVRGILQSIWMPMPGHKQGHNQKAGQVQCFEGIGLPENAIDRKIIVRYPAIGCFSRSLPRERLYAT